MRTARKVFKEKDFVRMMLAVFHVNEYLFSHPNYGIVDGKLAEGFKGHKRLKEEVNIVFDHPGKLCKST